ncbi:MAG: chromosomal replication initiator protein DnaA [Peptococcaceae bacterium]|nr:chromosomal replication initiator protein DnaA [Peptococcaceae bacterium]
MISSPDPHHASYLDSLWENILTTLREELKPAVSYDTWLTSTRLVDFSNRVLTISVPNEYALTWIEGRHAHRIRMIAQTILNQPVSLIFSVGQEGQNLKNPAKYSGTAPPSVKPFPLNPKYMFNTFVIGSGNRFAHAAALAVADSPAQSYNPLFIYGGSGLGKTHLMHAVGHVIQKNYPHLKIVYVTGEQFTNELIDSIRYEKQVEFRNTYRKVDLLLIDDIQFIAGKEGTQEEFFHTFNTLYEASKQVIISSDRSPREIPTLEERLRSRFEWGLTTDINPPDYETRCAILRKKSQLDNFDVPDEIISFIATEIQSNIRELEGAFIKVTAQCSLTDDTMTLEKAKEVLKDMLPQSAPPVTPEIIQKAVAEHYGLTVQDLKQKTRTRTISFPRQIAMYLCCKYTGLSLPDIGGKFGGRDHTTVLHARDKIKQLCEDPFVERSLNEIINKIRLP